MLQLNAAASTAIVISYVIFSLVLTVILAGIVVALTRLNAKLNEITTRVEPLLEKTESILALTNEKIATVGESTENILRQGEAAATTVNDKVGQTAVTVQRTVNAPIISLNSIAAGLSEGFSTFTRLQTRGSSRQSGSRSTAATGVPAAVATGAIPARTEERTLPQQQKSLPGEESPTLIPTSGNSGSAERREAVLTSSGTGAGRS